jgi:DNA-directed RNA polymerase sigma subunit (sigma70/sigma32)
METDNSLTTELERYQSSIDAILRARAISIVRWKDNDKMTFDAIGKQLGLTRQRVWKIYQDEKAASGESAPPVVANA